MPNIVYHSASNSTLTSEQKALKKALTTEIFEEILPELLDRLSEESFKLRNTHNFKGKKKEVGLTVDK